MEYLSGMHQFTQIAEQLTVVLLLFRAAFGALNCFMGYRLLKFWIAVCGFFLGTGIGAIGVHIFEISGSLSWILPLGAGIVAAVLAYEVYLVGAFFLGWGLTSYGILMVVRQLKVEMKLEVMLAVAGALLGILAGILVVTFARPCIIWLTAVSGGMSVATGICGILKIESVTVMLAAGVGCALLGALFQYKTTHK